MLKKLVLKLGLANKPFLSMDEKSPIKRELWRMRRAIGTQSIEQLKIESKRAADTLTETS